MLRKLIILLGFVISFSACQQDQRAIIVSKIRKASKLATTEFTVDKTVFATKDKKIIGLKLGEATFLAYTQAIIKTGIDLNRIDPEKIKIDKKSIRLTLPSVQVINFSYPAEKFRVDKEIFDERGWVHFTLQDYDNFYQQAEMDIRNSLQYMSIKKTSQDKTRQMIETLLTNLGYNEVFIEFEEGELIQPIEDAVSDRD